MRDFCHLTVAYISALAIRMLLPKVSAHHLLNHYGLTHYNPLQIQRFHQTPLSPPLSERKELRSPRLLVSEAGWMPGTAWTPVSLSHGVDEAESYGEVYKEGGSSWSRTTRTSNSPHTQYNQDVATHTISTKSRVQCFWHFLLRHACRFTKRRVYRIKWFESDGLQ